MRLTSSTFCRVLITTKHGRAIGTTCASAWKMSSYEHVADESNMILVMVKFDILGGRKARVVTIQPLSQEVALFTINFPGKDKTPVEVKAVTAKLSLFRKAIRRKTSTISLPHLPIHQVEPSPQADRARPVEVVVLSADRIVSRDAMIFHTVDSTSKPLSIEILPL